MISKNLYQFIKLYMELMMLTLPFCSKITFYSICLLFSMMNLMCTQEPGVDYSKIVHTFNEAWNTGNYDLLDETVHPEYFKQVPSQRKNQTILNLGTVLKATNSFDLCD